MFLHFFFCYHSSNHFLYEETQRLLKSERLIGEEKQHAGESLTNPVYV